MKIFNNDNKVLQNSTKYLFTFIMKWCFRSFLLNFKINQNRNFGNVIIETRNIYRHKCWSEVVKLSPRSYLIIDQVNNNSKISSPVQFLFWSRQCFIVRETEAQDDLHFDFKLHPFVLHWPNDSTAYSV